MMRPLAITSLVLALFAAVWVAIFIAPVSLQAQRSIVLLTGQVRWAATHDGAASLPGAVLFTPHHSVSGDLQTEQLALLSGVAPSQVPRTDGRLPGADLMPLADLQRAGYVIGGPASASTSALAQLVSGDNVEDPFSWLDLRASDGRLFFLWYTLTDVSQVEKFQSALERTGLARRTILAVSIIDHLVIDPPGALADESGAAARASNTLDVMPSLLHLLALTPSRPLGGHVLLR